MRRLAALVVLAGAAAVLAAAAPAETSPTVRVVAPVVNNDGQLAVTLACGGTAACTGSMSIPANDDTAYRFSIPPGASKTLKLFLAGPLHARFRTLKRVEVDLTQTVDGATLTSTRTYPLAFHPFASAGGAPARGGPGHPDMTGPAISAGPPTRYQAVHDRTGDQHSAFPVPVEWDIVSASAKRVGNAVVLSVTTTSVPGTMHDSYGNALTPCVELPFEAPGDGGGPMTPMFLSGGHDGQLIGYRRSFWPHVPMRISGRTVSWTVPHRLLFKRGFLWRASGNCDASHPADFAPDKGYETFRWAKVG